MDALCLRCVSKRTSPPTYPTILLCPRSTRDVQEGTAAAARALLFLLSPSSSFLVGRFLPNFENSLSPPSSSSPFSQTHILGHVHALSRLLLRSDFSSSPPLNLNLLISLLLLLLLLLLLDERLLTHPPTHPASWLGLGGIIWSRRHPSPPRRPPHADGAVRVVLAIHAHHAAALLSLLLHAPGVLPAPVPRVLHVS